jgi:DNA polymerase-3 subunit beta|tara:strand:- start:463 stop:1575 length:1113 start_codon:yes stop_codon:yes gene_type:complete
MKFSVSRDRFLKSLSYCQGVIEKRSTLPILSNILIEAKNSSIKITATDLDLIFINFINDVKITTEGSTTTSASIIYDIVRKLSSGSEINFNLVNNNKLQLESEKSKFNLLCLNPSDFPLVDENFNDNEFTIDCKSILKLLNKSKFSISSDETRHYLNGIFLHQTEHEKNHFLAAAATDSHRMSVSKIKLSSKIHFEPIILPKKTVYQLVSLLEDQDTVIKICNIKSKIKFEFDNSILISKLIDGKFPNYIQVIPINNEKKLEINLNNFLSSVDRVASVSTDKKEGVKFQLIKDILKLSVNNPNSGDGSETLEVKFDHELNISFNSKYLIDVASQIDGEKIIFYLNETGSPALIKDPIDKDSTFIIMPMKA